MKKYIFCTILFVTIACSLAFAGGGSNDTTQPINTQISIMTYNVKLLPRGATFLHHHPVIRARIIPAKLIEENPDVIVFQEAFDGLAIRILRNKLKAAYPYFMGNGNRKVISYKRAGGVLMFSKYPMRELESIRYTQCKGIDCMGNKGALLVEVAHPAQKFQVLGTHMQAGGSKELKRSQYVEAGQLLKRHEQNGVLQFAAGDFNTVKENAELYPDLVKALNADDGDINSELKFTSDHLLNDMDNYDPKRRRVIDYVFIRNNGVKPVLASRFVKEFEQKWSKKHKDLSDHNAVILRLKL